MQRDQFEFAGVVKNFRSPAMLWCRNFDLAQHGADVNRLAEVTIFVFTESQHVIYDFRFMNYESNANNRVNRKSQIVNSSDYQEVAQVASISCPQSHASRS